MAREEHDREDLLAEATAYVSRVELSLAGEAEPVFVGFRDSGLASFYFGAEPVYHFDSARALRRAFAQGRLLKAERGTLVALARRRTAAAVQLVREPLSAEQTRLFLDELQQRLSRLRTALEQGRYEVRGQVPAAGDVPGQVAGWLRSTAQIAIARSPQAR